MPKLLLILLLACCCVHSLAQGYIAFGDSLKQGRVHRNGNRSLTYFNIGETRGVDYSLDKVSEYRLKYSVYEALVIDGDRKFYRRLADGTVKLYRSGFHYALKTGDRAVLIRKRNFREELNNTLQLNATKDDLSRLSYSKPALIAVLNQNDKAGFDIKSVPYRKFGVIVGYNLLQFKTSPYLISLTKQVATPSVGLFADLPLSFKKNAIYLTPEVNASKQQVPFYQSDTNGHTNFVALNMQNVNILTSLKLVAGQGLFRPYGKVGVIASAINVKCPTGLVSTTRDGTNVYVNNIPLAVSQKGLQVGVNIAGGVQIPVGGRKNIHVEVRYTKSLNDALKDFKLNTSNVGISAGFSL
ncbi:MAG: hypothetical protein WDO15_22030 [Bacteroidota bacterium]